jgi:hypothetical protein
VALGGAVLADDPAGPPLRQGEAVAQHHGRYTELKSTAGGISCQLRQTSTKVIDRVGVGPAAPSP